MRQRGLSFERLTIGLLFIAIGFRALLVDAQADTFWALRAGQDIWRTASIPRVDTYSYTAAGLPWPDHEWLWQAFSYALYRVGGMPLYTLGGAVVVFVAVALAYRLMVGAFSTRFLLMVLAIPLASVTWALRPQIVTLLFLALTVRWLERERFARLPPLFVVWANAHGGVALGGAVILTAVATSWLAARALPDAARRRRVRRLVITAAACGLATFVTPLGVGLLRFVFESEARLRAAHVSEWAATLPGLSIAGAFWLLAVPFAAICVRRWRRLAGGTWSDWVVVGSALVLFGLAFRSVRHVGPFLLLAPAATSRLLGADFRLRRPGKRRSAPPSADHPRLNAAIFGVSAAAAATAVVLAWAAPFESLRWRPLPNGALAAVRACPGPLYNHYNEGGYLIWFAPEQKVFIDNRQDPFPLPFLLEHVQVESGQSSHEPSFARWGIRCSFLGVKSPTVAALEKDGWRTTYRDDAWAVQVAPPAVPRAP